MTSASITFYVLSGMLLWTVAGYFTFVKLLSFRKKLPKCQGDVPEFSIVLVVHNARKYIESKCQELRAYTLPELKKIIVVDDCSSDGSSDYLKSISDSRFELLFLERCGKSASLNEARKKCATTVAVLMDVRQSISEGSLKKLVQRLNEEGGYEAASGLLTLPGGDKSYWDMEKTLRYHEGLLGKTIGLSGSGCALHYDRWCELPDQALADDMALGLAVLSSGGRVCLDPEVKIEESLSSEMLVELRRKTRTLSANWQIFFSPLKYKVPLSPIPLFMVISHKFLRLFMPFMLLGLIVSGYLMHCQILNCIFWGAFSLALLSFLPLKFLSPIKQLIYLNVAAVAAFFLWPRLARQGHWKSS